MTTETKRLQTRIEALEKMLAELERSPAAKPHGVAGSAVGQAVVFGDAQPALSAVLWPVRADSADAELQAAVDAANATLPDYARIQRWVRGRANFDAASGMATANGRPQRAAILQLHADALGIAAAP